MLSLVSGILKYDRRTKIAEKSTVVGALGVVFSERERESGDVPHPWSTKGINQGGGYSTGYHSMPVDGQNLAHRSSSLSECHVGHHVGRGEMTHTRCL